VNEVKKTDIDNISKMAGLNPSEKTVIRIRDTDDENKKILELVEGSWEGKHPWFLIDEQDEYYALIPAKTLGGVFAKLKTTQEENFKLNLEKAILQNMPMDFEDVWVVAIKEIQKLSQKEGARFEGSDLSAIVRQIKEDHPNLFFHLSDLLALQNKR